MAARSSAAKTAAKVATPSNAPKGESKSPAKASPAKSAPSSPSLSPAATPPGGAMLLERRGSGAGVDDEEFDEFAASLAEVKLASTWRDEYGIDRKGHLNIVAIGWASIGKSTLLGQLLHDQRREFKASVQHVTKKVYKKVDLNAVAIKAQEEFTKSLPPGRVAAAVSQAVHNAKHGRAINFVSVPQVVHLGLASLVDRHQYERIYQMTKDMRVSNTPLSTAKYRVNLINIPGHVRYMPNAIKGISQADVAIIVIGPTASKKTEDIDMEKAMLKYQLVAARVFGVKHLIVVVNKCDTWIQTADPVATKEAFEAFKVPLATQLTSIGYKPAKLTYIPVSATANINLHTRSTTTAELSWYTGVSLMEAINLVPDIPVKSFHQLCNMPLRLVVNEAFHINNGVGAVAFACVRAGVLRKGQELVIANTNSGIRTLHHLRTPIVPPSAFGIPAKTAPPGRQLVHTSALSIQSDRAPVVFALPGDMVGVQLAGIKAGVLHRGQILGEAKHERSPVATFQPDSFIAEIIIFNKHPKRKALTIMAGYELSVHANTQDVTCAVRRIISKITLRNGAREENPKSLSTGEAAVVELTPRVRGTLTGHKQESIAVDSVMNCPPMSRLVLREGRVIIGAGQVEPAFPFRAIYRNLIIRYSGMMAVLSDIIACYL